MAIVRKLGSFPNSQIKPTSAVREADSTIVQVLASPGETQVLVANENRIKAILINNGPLPFRYDYQPGNVLNEGALIPVGGAIEIEGGFDSVWATGIGGATSIAIDDRLG